MDILNCIVANEEKSISTASQNEAVSALSKALKKMALSKIDEPLPLLPTRYKNQ